MRAAGWGKLVVGTAATLAALIALFVAPALARDRNHDQLPDGWEKQNHLSLRVKQAKRDTDRDKLNNRDEFKYKTNPRKADTDGDGLKDGFEVKIDYDPTDPDTDGDGIPDGQENIGYIGSFNGLTMTINLIRGGTVSGTVTPETDIECDRVSDNPDLDGTCTTADLRPGVLVSDAEYDELAPTAFDEIDLVGVS